MHRVRMLIHFGVIPYIVFDGDRLPSKAATEAERAKGREESKKAGLELYRLQKWTQAHRELQKAVDVTPEMALQLIDELKKIGVRYVVAPYEADAQLAYLERQGIIQGILSEDSDLLVFGAKQLLTKLDQYGDCVEISRANFTACREISLVGWSDAEFRRMAILSGCDYLASINGMGLKSAYRLVRKHKTIEQILRMLSFDGKYHVPPGYLEAFHKAELTFLHQRVYCPLKKQVVMMNDLPADAQPEDFSFIGGMVEQEIAIGVAKGELDPMTKQPLHVKDISKTAPGTPWVNSRRNTVNACSDTKATRSINSFFKPKRTPLAELDPNTFTPSPSQARLLRQANGLTWDSSLAPSRPPPLRSSASMPSGSGSALGETLSETFSSLGAALTRPNPQKRRRLCNDPSDRTDAEVLVASESTRSRFFVPNMSDPCSSTKRSRKNRTGKNADITIWSDDSIEDVMAELPDVADCPQPPKKGKMEIFKDDIEEKADNNCSPEKQDDKVSKEDTQCSTASRGTVDSKVSVSGIERSFTSSAPSVASALDKHVTSELKILAQKYTYRPETEREALKASVMESSKELGAGVSTSQAISKPPSIRERNMTPLERLGFGALNRSKSYSSFFYNTKNSAAKAEEGALLSRGSASVTSSFLGLPMAYGIGSDASMVKGSEDTIIPDSEDEGGSASEVEERTRSDLDLGRFAFTGQ